MDYGHLFAFLSQLCEEWLPAAECVRPVFRKLYQMRQDGRTPGHFHTRCDDRGPTLTLIQTQHGYVCGGYTSASWDSVSDFKACRHAFLFSVLGPGMSESSAVTHLPLRHDADQASHAIRCRSECGPFFGNGDFRVIARPIADGHAPEFSDVHSALGDRATSCYVSVGGKGGAALFPGGTSSLRDIEVFGVSPAALAGGDAMK